MQTRDRKGKKEYTQEKDERQQDGRQRDNQGWINTERKVEKVQS